MNRRKNFLLGACAAWVALAGTTAGQAGYVQRHKKVSELTGPFPGGLNTNDQMGRAVIAAGDIDGDGNCDLVSGAIGDDDGGTLGIDSDTGRVAAADRVLRDANLRGEEQDCSRQSRCGETLNWVNARKHRAGHGSASIERTVWTHG